MPAEARISSIWKKQKLFVALFLIAIGAWFFFDGFIGYPRNNARYQAWKAHMDEGREAAWPAYADQHGWKRDEWPNWIREHHPSGPRPEVPFGPDKIVGQYVFGSIGILLGLLMLGYWATQKNGVLRSEEGAVFTPGGKRVPFEAITGIGKKRWDSKGIAVVRYEIDGKKGQFIVDDYKFDTDPSRKILEEIETRLLARVSAESA